MRTGSKLALLVMVLADGTALDVATAWRWGFLTTWVVGFLFSFAMGCAVAYWMDRYEQRVRREVYDAICHEKWNS